MARISISDAHVVFFLILDFWMYSFPFPLVKNGLRSPSKVEIKSHTAFLMAA